MVSTMHVLTPEEKQFVPGNVLNCPAEFRLNQCTFCDSSRHIYETQLAFPGKQSLSQTGSGRLGKILNPFSPDLKSY